MTAIAAREMHRFRASGRDYVYLVPSAAIFALDEASSAILDLLNGGRASAEALLSGLAERFSEVELRESLEELARAQAIGPARVTLPMLPPKAPLPQPFPLTTLVLNVTNQCNLACTYCYEYGEDKLVDTKASAQPRFMTEETARASVDFMLRESGANRVAHLTFFGGETLLNFPVLKSTLAYARERGAALGKVVDFSLTTNATLLRPEIVDFLLENDVGITISMDGPKGVQDRFRVFAGGAGSYDVVVPRVKDLLRRHRGRPVGARVTLTSAGQDVVGIFRHLTEEVGFHEVGFAPVTTAPQREHALGDAGFDGMLGQFRALAAEFLEHAAVDEPHGFSNVKDTLAEIHKGVAKAWPCGAGLGLMGVATDGQVALCHRFAGSAEHRLGDVRGGIDRERQAAFLDAHHVADKTDCHTCWARPLCAGGCYHEAHTRYGSTTRPNLHYCEWIRGWTHTCLEIYGELSERNPRYLARFDNEGNGMKHLRAVNRKAGIVEQVTEGGGRGHVTAERNGSVPEAVAPRGDVVALQDPPQQPGGPHVPMGCSFVFFPGWEVDRNGGTAGLCQPVERDLFDCHIACFWPAQVPDQLNHAQDWTGQCAAAQKDWRKIDLIFP